MTYRLLCKRITYALRRLHTNPSDWIKIKHFRRSALFFGAANQIWTGDLILTKDVLYHLSHSSIFSFTIISDSVNHYKLNLFFCQVFFNKWIIFLKLLIISSKGVDKMLDKICLILSILGSINWGLVGIFQFDLVAWLFGGQDAMISRIIYSVIALAGIWCISLLFRSEHSTHQVSE